MPKIPIRPIRTEGNTAYVLLTRGYEAAIDAADVPLVDGYNWYALPAKSTVYAARNGGDASKTIRMHRVIAGDPIGHEVDHVDCDGLNNRRDNLRKATKSQNSHNRKTYKSNTSKFKGVDFDKANHRWRARIGVGGTRKHIGWFDSPHLAHQAYCEASAKYHGVFGRVE